MQQKNAHNSFNMMFIFWELFIVGDSNAKLLYLHVLVWGNPQEEQKISNSNNPHQVRKNTLEHLKLAEKFTV